MNDYSSGDPTAAMAGIMGAMGLVWLAVIVFFIFLYWKIFSKAGFSGWLSLLLLVPIGSRSRTGRRSRKPNPNASRVGPPSSLAEARLA